jgi:hypothetical protein
MQVPAHSASAEPHSQVPPLQMKLEFAHGAQACPSVWHCEEDVAVTHVSPSQQPVEQLLALHVAPPELLLLEELLLELELLEPLLLALEPLLLPLLLALEPLLLPLLLALEPLLLPLLLPVLDPLLLPLVLLPLELLTLPPLLSPLLLPLLDDVASLPASSAIVKSPSTP